MSETCSRKTCGIHLVDFPENTRAYDCSGIAFNIEKTAGVSMIFNDVERDCVVDISLPNPQLRADVDPKGVFKDLKTGSMSFGFTRRWLYSSSPYDTFKIKEVDLESDGHRRQTRALIEVLSPAIREFLTRQDPGFLTALPDETSLLDIPPSRSGTYPSLYEGYFNTLEGSRRHALRSYNMDPTLPVDPKKPEGPKRPLGLISEEETRREIRFSLETHFLDAHAASQEMQRESRPFVDMNASVFMHELNGLTDEVQSIGEAFSLLEESDVEEKTAKFTELEARIQGTMGLMTDLKPWFYYAQMKDVDFSKVHMEGYEQLEYVVTMLKGHVKAYTEIANSLESAILAFHQAETNGDGDAFQKGIQQYADFLRYLPAKDWRLYAGGVGPLAAMRRLRLGAVGHLVQDAVAAHCQAWNKENNNVCEDHATVNIFGKGTIHTEHNDLMTLPNGELKPEVTMAQDALLKLFLILPDADGLSAGARLKAVMDTYWPVSGE